MILLLAVLLVPFGAFSSADSVDFEHHPGNRHYSPSSSPFSTHESWLGYGGGIFNNRTASHAAVDSWNVASLHSICKKTYPAGGVSAAPLVTEGMAYYSTWSGSLVALDYHRCYVKWELNITKIVVDYGVPFEGDFAGFARPVSRTTPVMDGNVLFLGTQVNALLLAIDRTTGKLLDKFKINPHPIALITQSPTFWEGKIFVGASSAESSAVDFIPNYECCSFRSNMNAFAFENGRLVRLWSQDMIPPGLNFSGAAIWGSQPSIDPVRKQVFFATGNLYSAPPEYANCENLATEANFTQALGNATDPCAPKTVYQESILAIDIPTGRLNWVSEHTPIDAWTTACVPIPGFDNTLNPDACPPKPGPDADFGMAPSFVPGSEHTPSGKDIIVVGQKNGNLYAFNAADGALLWALATSPDGVFGGLIWGLAVDSRSAYFTSVNANRTPWRLVDGTSLSNGAFGAASLVNGKVLWQTEVPRNGTSLVTPTIANDVVLTGRGGPYSPSALNVGPGSLIALDKTTGRLLKEFDLGAYFQAGIAVVGDLVLFGTGYSGVSGSFNMWKIGK